MLEDMSKDALFYNYYAQWIEVYKKDAIREATMAKYSGNRYSSQEVGGEAGSGA